MHGRGSATDEITQHRSDAVLLISQRDRIGYRFDRGGSVAHSNPESRSAQHLYIVRLIAERDRRGYGHVKQLAQPHERSAL